MNKGFTLVELLAVMVILGIVLVIAIPRISDVIDNSKLEAFIRSEERIINATKLYLADNRDKIPLDIGNTNEVTITDLITEGLIEKVQDPNNKNNQCNGYILVTKINNDYYDYTPHINCIDTERGSAEADGLILHYKFDDFQEWTENLVDEPWAGFNNRSHMIMEDVSFPNPFNFPVIKKFSHTEADPRTSDQRTIYRFYDLDKTKTHTFSTYVFIPSNTEYSITSAPIFRVTQTTVSEWTTTHALPISNIIIHSKDIVDQWQRISVTFEPDSNNEYDRYNILYYHRVGLNHHFYTTGSMLEEKSYITPFTNGIRGGLVKDYSNNNNNVVLEQNSPRWIDNCKVTNGCYQFNGINSYILTNNLFQFSAEDSFSVSFWINIDDHSHKAGAAAGLIGKGHWYDNTWDIFLGNTNRINFEVSGNPVRDGRVSSSTPILQEGEWYFYTAVYDNRTIKIYLNGEIVNTATYNGAGNFTNNRLVVIGMRPGDTSRIFSGIFDDIRLYNRALSDNEIENMYKLDLHRNK